MTISGPHGDTGQRPVFSGRRRPCERTLYLAPGLPQPVPAPDGLDAPFWAGPGRGEDSPAALRVIAAAGSGARNGSVITATPNLSMDFEPVTGEGVIYSYERVWHPVHPALTDQGPLSGGAGRALPGAGGQCEGRRQSAWRSGGGGGHRLAESGPLFEHHRDADPCRSHCCSGNSSRLPI